VLLTLGFEAEPPQPLGVKLDSFAGLIAYLLRRIGHRNGAAMERPAGGSPKQCRNIGTGNVRHAAANTVARAPTEAFVMHRRRCAMNPHLKTSR
jgi:hypothetical protein